MPDVPSKTPAERQAAYRRRTPTQLSKIKASINMLADAITVLLGVLTAQRQQERKPCDLSRAGMRRRWKVIDHLRASCERNRLARELEIPNLDRPAPGECNERR